MVHHAEKSRKQRKPLITTLKKNTFKKAGKNSVKDKEGYAWKHVQTTSTEAEANRLGLFYKGMKKDYKIVRNGDQFEVFERRG